MGKKLGIVIVAVGVLILGSSWLAPPKPSLVTVNAAGCPCAAGGSKPTPPSPDPATKPEPPATKPVTSPADDFSKIRMCWPRPRPGSHPAHPLGLHVTPSQAAMEPSKRWQNGSTITYALFGGNSSAQAEFRAAVADVSQYVNLTFRETPGNQTADVRVTFVQDGRSWSNVGQDCRLVPEGQATMNLGWPDDLGRSKHELLHACGLMHNQAIPNSELHLDARKCYGYFGGPPNNWPPEMVDSQVLYVFRGTYIGSGFDRASIMQYAVAPELTTDGKGIGWNQVLSTTDIHDLEFYYPKPVAHPPAPPVTPPPLPPVAPPVAQTVSAEVIIPQAGTYPVGLRVGESAAFNYLLTTTAGGRYRITLSAEAEASSAPASAAMGKAE